MYNCYYHPKVAGSNICKGCKMPVCSGCQGEGLCPQCVKTHAAVDGMRALRSSLAAKPKTASTTARLRLAIRQMGPVNPAPASPRAQMATRPLPNLDEVKPVAYSGTSHSASSGAARKPARRRATGKWTYAPEKLAYRAPENLHEVQGRRPAKAQQIQGLSKVQLAAMPSNNLWWAICAAVLLFVIGTPAYHYMTREAPKPQLKALYTPLSHKERAAVNQTLEAAPAPKHYIDLPDATIDTRPLHSYVPAPVQAAPVARPVAARAAVVAPVAAAPAPVYVPRPVYRAAAPAPVYAARSAYAAPRVRRAYAAIAPTRVERHGSLSDAMHFSATGGHHGSVEVIHW